MPKDGCLASAMSTSANSPTSTGIEAGRVSHNPDIRSSITTQSGTLASKQSEMCESASTLSAPPRGSDTTHQWTDTTHNATVVESEVAHHTVEGPSKRKHPGKQERSGKKRQAASMKAGKFAPNPRPTDSPLENDEHSYLPLSSDNYPNISPVSASAQPEQFRYDVSERSQETRFYSHGPRDTPLDSAVAAAEHEDTAKVNKKRRSNRAPPGQRKKPLATTTYAETEERGLLGRQGTMLPEEDQASGQQTLQDRLLAIKRREEEVERREVVLREKERAVGDMENALTSREDAVSRRENEVAEREERVAENEDALEYWEEELSGREAEFL